MESLVTAALHGAVVHLKPLLIFGSNWHLLPGTAGLLNGVHLGLRFFKLLLVRGRLQLQTLHCQLLDPVSQAAGTVLNLRPEVIAPEGILAHSSLQSLEPKVERRKTSLPHRHVVALKVAGKEARDRDESDGGFGVHHMQHNAGGATFSQVPIMFLAQNAVQPCICTASFALESTFRLSGARTGQDTSRNARRLGVEEEQWDEEGVDDVAVETERLLVLVGAGIAMVRAEAIDH